MASLQDELTSTIQEHRLAALEALVFRSLNFTQPDDQIQAFANAYRYLSDRLLSGREGGQPSGLLGLKKRKGDFEESHLLAVWGCIYGARTFELASQLLDEYGPSSGTAVEIGSGWGPFGLAAALRGYRVKLYEVSETALSFGHRLFQNADLPPSVREAHYRIEEPADCIAIPYSLGELVGMDTKDRLDKAESLIRHWLARLRPGGRLYLFESGDRRGAALIQELRDRLVDSVPILAPCTGAPSCPLVNHAHDWCHFTLAMKNTPLVEQVFRNAGRNSRSFTSSWLILGRSDEPVEDQERFRLLWKRKEPRKVRWNVCGSSGLSQINMLKRDEVYREGISTSEGSLVALRMREDEKRGDGFRIRQSEDLVFIRRW